MANGVGISNSESLGDDLEASNSLVFHLIERRKATPIRWKKGWNASQKVPVLLHPFHILGRRWRKNSQVTARIIKLGILQIHRFLTDVNAV